MVDKRVSLTIDQADAEDFRYWDKNEFNPDDNRKFLEYALRSGKFPSAHDIKKHCDILNAILFCYIIEYPRHRPNKYGPNKFGLISTTKRRSMGRAARLLLETLPAVADDLRAGAERFQKIATPGAQDKAEYIFGEEKELRQLIQLLDKSERKISNISIQRKCDWHELASTFESSFKEMMRTVMPDQVWGLPGSGGPVTRFVQIALAAFGFGIIPEQTIAKHLQRKRQGRHRIS